MKTIYCLGCRRNGNRSYWFDAKLGNCPKCGWLRPGFNKPLRTAMLNNHLYSQVESANREKQVEQRLMGGR